MSAVLTTTQWQLLDFLKAYIRDHRGLSPSYEEIRVAMGWKTKGNVNGHLTALASRGFIRWRPAMQRSIELADGPISLNLPAEVAKAVRRAASERGITTEKFIVGALCEKLNLGSSIPCSLSRETPSSDRSAPTASISS